MIIIPAPVPIIIPTFPLYYGGGIISGFPVGDIDWKHSPEWANYVSINIIGGYTWWYDRPKWDFIAGVWSGDFLHASADVSARKFKRGDRKKSLQSRPAGVVSEPNHYTYMKVTNTPIWDDAPKWANYAAVVSGGMWYWFEEKPSWDLLAGTWSISSTRSKPSNQYPHYYHRSAIKNSLQKRK